MGPWPAGFAGVRGSRSAAAAGRGSVGGSGERSAHRGGAGGSRGPRRKRASSTTHVHVHEHYHYHVYPLRPPERASPPAYMRRELGLTPGKAPGSQRQSSGGGKPGEVDADLGPADEAQAEVEAKAQLNVEAGVGAPSWNSKP